MIDLRKRRQELGVSLETVAQVCGVNKSTVSRWESKGVCMKRDKLKPLASVLRVPLVALIEDSEASHSFYIWLGKLLKRIREARGWTLEDAQQRFSDTQRNPYTPDLINEIETRTDTVDYYLLEHYIWTLAHTSDQVLEDIFNHRPSEFANFMFEDYLEYDSDELIDYLADELAREAKEHDREEKAFEVVFGILEPFLDRPNLPDLVNKLAEYARFLVAELDSRSDG